VHSSRDFADVHGLVIHAYNPPNTDSLVDHLGLHKALCVLMGWDYTKIPDNSKGYQSLSADLVRASREDLIVWPPTVIIRNTATGRKKDGRLEGLGNKDMDKKMAGIFILQPLTYENLVFAYSSCGIVIIQHYIYFIGTLSYLTASKQSKASRFFSCWVVEQLFVWSQCQLPRQYF
jgi:hypothetical protein